MIGQVPSAYAALVPTGESPFICDLFDNVVLFFETLKTHSSFFIHHSYRRRYYLRCILDEHITGFAFKNYTRQSPLFQHSTTNRKQCFYRPYNSTQRITTEEKHTLAICSRRRRLVLHFAHLQVLKREYLTRGRGKNTTEHIKRNRQRCALALNLL